MRHAIHIATVDRGPADISCAAVASGYLDHIRKINEIFYDQLKASDQKAAYIFTIMLAFLATAPTDRLLSAGVGHSVGSGIEAGMAALFVIASGLSLAAAILAVLPRHVAKSTSLFWGDWSRHRDILAEGRPR